MRFGCLFFSNLPVFAYRRGGGETRPLAILSGGRVAAVCRRARRAGVLPGMPASRVSALLPQARLCLRDRHLEQAVWEDVLAGLNRLTPFIEPLRPGVAFFAGLSPEAVLPLVRPWGASAGFASHRSSAHLAAVKAGPGSVLPVASSAVRSFLARVSVETLADFGFSDDMVERLRLFGYPDLLGVSGLLRRRLSAQFGPEGTRLFDLLHPGDELPVGLYAPPPVVRVSYDFDWPVADAGEVVPVVRHLAEEAVRSLGSGRCRRVTLAIHAPGGAALRLACRVLPEAVGEARRLAQTALTLLMERAQEGYETSSVVLELGALQAVAPVQRSLFFTRPPLHEAARALERTFPGAALRAVVAPHAVFEDEAVRFEPYPTEAPKGRRRRKSV